MKDPERELRHDGEWFPAWLAWLGWAFMAWGVRPNLRRAGGNGSRRGFNLTKGRR